MTVRVVQDPILILCTPRSYSSVVCAMLGQHPQLYGFPELNLFVADVLGELLRLGDSQVLYGASYVTGLLRTIAELEFFVQSDETIRYARGWISAHSHWTTKQMFDWLLVRIYPKIGIDKSPRTSLSKRSIDRAFSSYPNSRVIHLTRHPISTLRSLLKSHQNSIDYKLNIDFVWLADFYARFWIQSQESILSIVQQLNRFQVIRVRAEDILFKPDIYLARLSEWLAIDSGPSSIQAMKHPEQSPYSRPAPMNLDGDGDANFLRYPQLRPLMILEAPSAPPEWNIKPALIEKMNNLSCLLGYGSLR